MKKINYLMALCLSALGGFSMAQAQTTVQVHYTYTHDGVEIGGRTVEETVGAAPADQASLPPYVTATGYPETIGENDTEIPITTTYNENLPFRVSDGTGDPVYYRVWFRHRGNGKTYGWRVGETDNNGNIIGKEAGENRWSALTVATQENYKWEFGGNWFDGFTIKAQSGRYLTAPATIANSQITTLETTADENKSHFYLEYYPNSTDWRFRLKENAGFYLAHTSANSLNLTIYQRYQNNNEYAGAQVCFEEMGDFGEMIDALKAKAEVVNRTGIGFPKSDSQVRADLQAQSDLVNAITHYDSYAARVEPLQTAYDAFIGSQDVQLLENGKAYTITFRPTNAETGTYRYINFNGTTLQTVAMTSKDDAIPESGVFVCRSRDDNGTTKYSLVPAYGSTYGQYLAYKWVTPQYADGSSNTLVAGGNDFTVASMNSSSSGMIADKSPENLFGYVYFLFVKRSNDSSRASVYVMREDNGEFDASDVPFLGTNGTRNYTSALIVKEVPYPSSVHLNAADGIDGVEGIGTFSAPYNAVVPEGVTAYYVENVDGANGEKWAHTVSLTAGEAVPAGQGVLLTGEAGTDVVMAPAAGETVATVGNNLLGASAGEAKEIPAAENAYILTKKNDVVGFYNLNATDRTLAVNKAYLVMPADAAAQQIKLDFGHGTTGIGAVEPAAGAADNVPVYDLSGRRVVQPVRGGIYFKAGRKFILK